MVNYEEQAAIIDRLFPEAVNWRRQLHRNAQPSWLEFYATGLIAEKLTEWGYTVTLGKDVVDADNILMPPSSEKLEEQYQWALAAGIKEEFIAPAKNGLTGVVAVLKGNQPGPTVGFRFDIDCNEVIEANDEDHRPAREGFMSEQQGYAHMCGHDVHTSIGLLLARYFSENRSSLNGTLKFIFQPSEEGLAGAAAMVPTGIVDDLDYLFSGHVGITLQEIGQIALNVTDFYAMSRFKVTYRGRPSHAALRPDEGKNALLGACSAVTNLYAIARHGVGASRINVGTLEAGTAWNVIPDQARFRLETRGISTEINQYMIEKANEVLKGAAIMYGLEMDIELGAAAPGGVNTPELIVMGTDLAGKLPSVQEIIPSAGLNASEDVSLMMRRVQSQGGKALFALFGTPVGGGHHNAAFDVDESVIGNAVKFLVAVQELVAR